MNPITLQTLGATSSTLWGAHHVIAAQVFPERIEITYRAPSNCSYASVGGGPVPDRIWKDVWEIQYAGSAFLVKTRTIEGQHIPARLNPEQIIFPSTPDQSTT